MTIEIPPSGRRGVSTRIVRMFRLFNPLSVWMYRRRGRDSSGRAGLLLTTIGIVAAAPGYGPYEQTTDREIPVVRLTPGREADGEAPTEAAP
jgi:hypothetical protein